MQLPSPLYSPATFCSPLQQWLSQLHPPYNLTSSPITLSSQKVCLILFNCPISSSQALSYLFFPSSVLFTNVDLYPPGFWLMPPTSPLLPIISFPQCPSRQQQLVHILCPLSNTFQCLLTLSYYFLIDFLLSLFFSSILPLYCLFSPSLPPPLPSLFYFYSTPMPGSFWPHPFYLFENLFTSKMFLGL